LLAAAIACHLERAPGAGRGAVALVLVDGAPAPPAAPLALPPPAAYAAFCLAAEAGAPLAELGAHARVGPWHAFVREFEAAVAAAEAEGPSEAAPTASAPAPLMSRALRRLATRFAPSAAGAAWRARVEEAVRACELAARLSAGYACDFVYQGEPFRELGQPPDICKTCICAALQHAP
jgi:hypothetical protein